MAAVVVAMVLYGVVEGVSLLACGSWGEGEGGSFKEGYDRGLGCGAQLSAILILLVGLGACLFSVILVKGTGRDLEDQTPLPTTEETELPVAQATV